ncbi:hypothetical protein LPJ73_008839, partial [Coemansia sp. RSA 2703]
MTTPDRVGRSLQLGPDVGIVRYQGSVDETSGEWLGIEWLTAGRGKHDGSHSGRQYFVCQQPGMYASFIRPVRRISWACSLLAAAKAHYMTDPDELVIPLTIDGRRGRIEAVGLDKIAKAQSDLASLTVLNLNACMVDGSGTPAELEETKNTLRSVQTLSLAKNLLTQWSHVLDIVRVLPLLSTLDISANYLVSPVPVTEERFTIDTLRVDTSPRIRWQDAISMAHQLGARSFSFGWCRLTDISATPADWAIRELHL